MTTVPYRLTLSVAAAAKLIEAHCHITGVELGDCRCSCDGWSWREPGQPRTHAAHLAQVLDDSGLLRTDREPEGCLSCGGRVPDGWRFSEEWAISGCCPDCIGIRETVEDEETQVVKLLPRLAGGVSGDHPGLDLNENVGQVHEGSISPKHGHDCSLHDCWRWGKR